MPEKGKPMDLNIAEAPMLRDGQPIIYMQMWDGKGEPPSYPPSKVRPWVEAAVAEASKRGFVFIRRDSTPLERMLLSQGRARLYFHTPEKDNA